MSTAQVFHLLKLRMVAFLLSRAHSIDEHGQASIGQGG